MGVAALTEFNECGKFAQSLSRSRLTCSRVRAYPPHLRPDRCRRDPSPRRPCAQEQDGLMVSRGVSCQTETWNRSLYTRIIGAVDAFPQHPEGYRVVIRTRRPGKSLPVCQQHAVPQMFDPVLLISDRRDYRTHALPYSATMSPPLDGAVLTSLIVSSRSLTS